LRNLEGRSLLKSLSKSDKQIKTRRGKLGYGREDKTELRFYFTP